MYSNFTNILNVAMLTYYKECFVNNFNCTYLANGLFIGVFDATDFKQFVHSLEVFNIEFII